MTLGPWEGKVSIHKGVNFHRDLESELGFLIIGHVLLGRHGNPGT